MRTRTGTWDQYFMGIAKAASAMSTCPRASVGAVVVANHRIISTGYNGAPSGIPHCDDSGCLMVDGRCKRAVHAELNAVVFARGLGQVLYCTHKPCLECLKVIMNTGIDRIVFLEDYEDPTRDAFLRSLASVRQPLIQRIEP